MKQKIDKILASIEGAENDGVAIQEEKLKPLSTREIAEMLNEKKEIKSPISPLEIRRTPPMPAQQSHLPSQQGNPPPPLPPSITSSANPYNSNAQSMPYPYGYYPQTLGYSDQYSTQSYTNPPYSSSNQPTATYYNSQQQPPYPPKSQQQQE